MREYHAYMKAILGSLVSMQKGPGMKWNLTYKGQSFDVVFQSSTMLVIGDTDGHDMLCGRYKARATNIRVSRDCDCLTAAADNPNVTCTAVLQADIEKLINDKNEDSLQSISQHLVENAFYELCWGGNAHGIHGLTPYEPLHAIREGSMERIVECFLGNFGKPVGYGHIDRMAMLISDLCRHQSEKDVPRLNFPHGITTLSKVKGEDWVGVCFIIFIMCVMAQTKSELERMKLCYNKRLGYKKALEMILCFDSWHRLYSFPKWHLNVLDDRCERLCELIKSGAPRHEGLGWRNGKFHGGIKHTGRVARELGSSRNFDGEPCEEGMKAFVKEPGEAALKRVKDFHVNAAKKLGEYQVIDIAYRNVRTEEPRDEQNHVKKRPTLTGSRFLLHLEEDSNGNIANVHIEWETKTPKEEYPQSLMHYIAEICAESDELQVTGYSEFYHKGCGQVFWCHPSFRQGHPWYDWASIKWHNDEEEDAFYLGCIKCFLKLPTIEHLDITAGMYAVILSAKNPIPERKWEESIHYDFVMEDPVSDDVPRYRIVPIESIDNPAFVIQNMGAVRSSYFHIAPKSEWSSVFIGPRP